MRLALLGHPNCGKTALFNLLTGSRQKVANYAGVTVERKEGVLTSPAGKTVRVLDLPGAYSLNALSADEAVTRDVVTGQRAGEAAPDLLVCVVDATKLQLGLRMVLEARAMGLPMVVAMNMSDAARRQGIAIDRALLERELGMPVVETVGIRKDGASALVQWLDGWQPAGGAQASAWQPQGPAQVLQTQQEVRRILRLAVREPEGLLRRDDAIDRVVLHPLWGMLVLAATMFLMFQAVFSWAAVPMDAIESGVGAVGEWLQSQLPEGLLRSLLVDGIVAGAGGVLVFLPQIVILFFFILTLEDSGYLPRAAFLLDRVMGSVGLSGRSFIPLLSSFACAIPGIMATRTITHWRERLVTIMIAPLMTCSARLPVYALLIAAFIPRARWRAVQPAGAGDVRALPGRHPRRHGRGLGAQALARQVRPTPLMMELPSYRCPARAAWRSACGARGIFVQAGGRHHPGADGAAVVPVQSFPAPPEGATGAAIAVQPGRAVGRALEPVFAPHRLQLADRRALVPGMAAREVAVSALGTVYALSATGDDRPRSWRPDRQQWSLATALSLLAWFVFAPQCISTLATVRRETRRSGWRPGIEDS
jgi:ferrous iron transport protein B